MIVYAIFLCLQAAASCDLAQPPYTDAFGDDHPTPIYRTLEACQQAMLNDYAGGVGMNPAAVVDASGRYMAQPGVWYECRHRHVDTWDSQ